MKKFKKISYILLIVIIIVLGFVIYSISASDTKQDVKEKTKSEIYYFESKFVYMLNSLNNIEFENYKLNTEDISKKSKKSSENSSSAGNGDDSSGGSSSENSSGGEEGSSEDSGSRSSSNSDNSSKSQEENKIKKYSLNTKGLLTSDKEINWEYIKNETEMLQSSISNFTLDLYEVTLNNNDILNFSKEFDNLLVAIKSEDKEQSLRELVLLYSYIPKFIKNCDVDLQTEIVYSTKYSIFKAYSILDAEKWDEVSNYIQEAVTKYSKMLTDVNIQNKNQYTVNRCYILLNELQNSTNVKDKEIFLIKYRNLLEDLNNL